MVLKKIKGFKNMAAIEKDMIQWVDELDKQKNENVFDENWLLWQMVRLKCQ